MNTKVSIAGVELKNPITVASGTFGRNLWRHDEGDWIADPGN